MGEWAGQPNYFTNKIMKAMWIHHDHQTGHFIASRTEAENEKFDRIKVFEDLTVYQTQRLAPKIHTIRTGNRWRPGMKIHPVINNRTKDRFQFAPTIECVSVQRVRITYYNSNSDYPAVRINNNVFYMYEKHGVEVIEKLAINDGFDSIEQFFAYFNQDFVGQIVSWTDLTY